jgi:hypothetical protein
MIIRGGGATGALGLTGADACIWVTLSRCGAGGGVTGATPASGVAGGVARGGTTTTDGGIFVGAVAPAAGELATGGVTCTFGGITTTEGGR